MVVSGSFGWSSVFLFDVFCLGSVVVGIGSGGVFYNFPLVIRIFFEDFISTCVDCMGFLF